MKQHFFKKNLFLGGFCSLFLGSSMVAPKDFGRYICSLMPNYRVDLQIMAEKETYCLFDDYEKHPGNYSLDPIREVKHDEEKVFYEPLCYINSEHYIDDNGYKINNELKELRIYEEGGVEINIEDLKQNFINKRREIRLNFKNRPHYYVNEDFFHDMYNHGIMHRPFIINHIFFKLLGSIWGNEELESAFKHVMETDEGDGLQASILRDVFKKTLSQKEYDFLINNSFFQNCDGFKFIIETEGVPFLETDLEAVQTIRNIGKKIKKEEDIKSANTELDLHRFYTDPKTCPLSEGADIMSRSVAYVTGIFITLDKFAWFDDIIFLSGLIFDKDVADNDIWALYTMSEEIAVGSAICRDDIYRKYQYFPRNDYQYFHDLNLESTMDSMVMVSKKFHYEKSLGEKYNDVKKILKDHFVVIEENEESNIHKKKLFDKFFIDLKEKFTDHHISEDSDSEFIEDSSDSDVVKSKKRLYNIFFITFLGIFFEMDKQKLHYWKGEYDSHFNIFRFSFDGKINEEYEIFFTLCIKKIWSSNIEIYLKSILAKVRNQEEQLKYFAQLKEILLYKGNIANYPYKGFTTNMSSLNIWDYLIDDFEDIYKIITFYKNNYNQYDEKDVASMNFLEDSIFMDLRSAFIPFFNNKVVDNSVNTIYRSLAPHIIKIIKLDNSLDAMKKRNPSLYIIRNNMFNGANGIGGVKWQEIEDMNWMKKWREIVDIDLIKEEKREDVFATVEDVKGEEIYEDIGEGAEKYKDEYMGWITEGRMEETKDEKMEEERKEGEQKSISVKPDTKIEQIVEKVLQNEHRTSLGEKVIPGKIRK